MTIEIDAISFVEIYSEIMKCCSFLDTCKSAYTKMQTHFLKHSASLLINIYSRYVFFVITKMRSVYITKRN